MSIIRNTACLIVLSAVALAAQFSILTNRYDNGRTGANTVETILNPTSVNVQSFGKLYSYPVDGSVYAQPLYVPNLFIKQGTHNVLYVCTMNDTVYAFDADQNQTLWSVNFTNAAQGITPVPIADITGSDDLNIVGFVGIESTPVIDPSTNTMYLVARTKQVTGSTTSYVQRLHALDITTGVEKFGGPTMINASYPGTGEQSVGGMVPFNGKMNNQRSGLALANGQVIIGWASHEDDQPYHGWVMSYSASTLLQTGVFCDTPNGSEGGIWQSGRAPAVDPLGNVYFLTGNGTADLQNDLGESALRFSTSGGIKLTDYFTSSDAVNLNNGDVDLGSSGLIFMPKINKLVGGGKQGIFYLFNPGNLGHYVPGDTQVPQEFRVTSGEIKPGPAYWLSAAKGPLVYVWGESDNLKAFHYNGTNFDTSPLLQSTITTPPGEPGATIVISASGSVDTSAILWASMPINQDADHGIVAGILRAINATNPTQELWNSQLNPTRDATGYFAKFTPPVVVNGKVYMASFSDYVNPNSVNVFGVLAANRHFTIAASPSAVTVRPGSSATTQIQVMPEPGYQFGGTVGFTVQGLPAGLTAAFNPAEVTGSGSTTLTLTVTAAVPLGSYSLAVTGTAVQTGITAKAALALNVSNTNYSISLNFVGTGATLQPSDMAGVIPKGNWNNLIGAVSNGPQPLADETGTVTTATALWTSENPWMMPIAGSPANFAMMQGYLDDLNGGTTTVTLAGLPSVPNGYQIYVYTDGDNAGSARSATYSVTGPGVTGASILVTDLGNTNFSGTFTLATAAQTNGNYVVFTAPGPGFTITATPQMSVDGNLRAPVNGIEIMPQ